MLRLIGLGMGHARNALSRDCYSGVNDRITRSSEESVARVYRASFPFFPPLFVFRIQRGFADLDNRPLNYANEAVQTSYTARCLVGSVDFPVTSAGRIRERIRPLSDADNYP